MKKTFKTHVTLCALLLTGTAAVAAISPFEAEPTDRNTPPAAETKPPAARQPSAAPQGAEPSERAPTPNPLWGIPLKQLSVTRDRPIFSPSRRPPQPPAVAAPAPPPPRPAAQPAAPDRPALSLVGTIASELDGIGIFVDQATRKAVRLRVGEKHEGWILRSVHRTGAALQKNHETVFVTFPPPASNKAGGPTPPPLPPPMTTAQPAIPANPPSAQSQSNPGQSSGQLPAQTPPVQPGAMPQGFSSPFAAPPTNRDSSSPFLRPPSFKRPE